MCDEGCSKGLYSRAVYTARPTCQEPTGGTQKPPQPVAEYFGLQTTSGESEWTMKKKKAFSVYCKYISIITFSKCGYMAC